MELELKHIAPYALHGLRLFVSQKFKGDWYGKLTDIDFSSKTIRIKGDGEHSHIWKYQPLSNVKPILRPLSDYNGPHGWYDEDQHEIHLSSTTENELFIHNILDDCTDIPIKAALDLLEILFEQHYDVFGLIEQGLAIDINTLNKND